MASRCSRRHVSTTERNGYSAAARNEDTTSFLDARGGLFLAVDSRFHRHPQATRAHSRNEPVMRVRAAMMQLLHNSISGPFMRHFGLDDIDEPWSTFAEENVPSAFYSPFSTHSVFTPHDFGSGSFLPDRDTLGTSGSGKRDSLFESPFADRPLKPDGPRAPYYSSSKVSTLLVVHVIVGVVKRLLCIV